MNSVPVFVGLDYHSMSVQVCVVDAEGRTVMNRRCENSAAEVAGLVASVGTVRRAAVEACCGAADFAEELTAATGWSVSLAHPGYVARMKHNPDKTDFSDARMLAELCRVGMLPEVWLAPEPVRELRVLVRFRFDQVRRRTNAKLRLLALLREQRIRQPAIGRWTLTWLAWLRTAAPVSPAGRWVVEQHLAEIESITQRIRQAEAQLAEATSEDPIVAKLLALPGIGPVTAWTMRAIIGRFDRFRNGKQLARFCALSPRNRSSGQRQADAGLIKAGDPVLKGVLIQAAQRLRLHNPRWRELFDRLRAGGKPVCVAIAAVANRLGSVAPPPDDGGAHDGLNNDRQAKSRVPRRAGELGLPHGRTPARHPIGQPALSRMHPRWAQANGRCSDRRMGTHDPRLTTQRPS